MRTEKHKKYWSERKIDWKQSYSSTWNHPHRDMMVEILKRLGKWHSLFEVGCASGPNLMRIVREFDNVQVGGCDVSADAIEEAKSTFQGAFLKVGSVEDIMVSDNFTDIVLSDMCLIYIDPLSIDRSIKEIKRVARSYIILCELHSESFFGRMKLRLTSGYNAYNYKKLLTKHGFQDITLMKIPKELWDGKPQKPYGYYIIARVPKY